jgi:hypothetical protein
LNALSFTTKKLPVDGLESCQSAIFKKGKKSEVGNYRPVILASVVCKIMESIMTDNVMEYFIKIICLLISNLVSLKADQLCFSY